MKRSLLYLMFLGGLILLNGIAPVFSQISTTGFVIDATSNPATPTQPDGLSASIATGEVVTLRMQFVLPESTVISLRVDSTFGTSFNYVGSSARVSYLADQVPSMNASFSGIQNQLEPGLAFPASRLTIASNTVSFDFDSIINNDGDAGVENLIIEYDLIPAAGAAIGTIVNMSYTLFFDEGLPTEVLSPSNQISLEISDPPGVSVTQSGGSTDVTEGGAVDTFTVALISQPSASVTINLTPDAQVTTAPTTLSFNSGNWNIGQEVTVTAVDDAVAEGAHSGSVSLILISGDVNYDGLSVPAVSVGITDNDFAGITITPESGLITTEAGGTAEFTVVLNSQPSSSVTIDLSSSDTTEGTVSPAQAIFTDANWSTAQTITVTGVDDAVQDGDVAYSIITTPAVSTDADYSGLDAADVQVTNADDDSAALRVAPSALSLAEGQAGSYTINLVTPPTGSPVIVQVEFPADQVMVSGNREPFALTFTDSTPQTITLSVLENFDQNTSRVAFIQHTITGSGAPEYPVGTQAVVTLTIDDAPTPPPSPTCESENFSENGVVRTGIPDTLAHAINCRILYYNTNATTWLGGPLYSEANLGVAGLIDLGIVQAVDIFSPPPTNLTYFEGGIVMCLRGEGTLVWLAAGNSQRIPQIVGSYTVPEFAGFTCVSLFEPGTLILVSRNPIAP